MSLCGKSFVIIGLTLFFLLFSLYLTTNSILHNGYTQLERSDMERNVKRALKAIENEGNFLENIVKDWGQWDDSYNFMVTGSKEYINANLDDMTFTYQHLNVVLYTDLDGQIVYIRAYDWDNRKEISLSNEAVHKLTAVKPLADSGKYAVTKGILTLPEGQMLVAAGAVTDSQGTASSRGVLLAGRFITNVEKVIISEMVQLPIDFVGWNCQLPPEFADARTYLTSPAGMYVKTVNDDYVAGYTMLEDIYGQPALILRVLGPRIITQQAQHVLNYFIVMLIAAGLVFGTVILALLEWSVLTRLASISNVVKKIAQQKDLSIRLAVSGHDELTELTENINNMLGSLEKAQTRLKYVGRHDALTGLYNRTIFEEFLTKSNCSNESVQIIMADVDGLKLINDTLGHASGDALLRKAAEVLKQMCPPDAIIARCGGDEFAVLLKNHPAEAVADLCRAIKAAAAEAEFDTLGLTLSMSIGYAVGTKHTDTAAELLKEADNHMYRDKLLRNRSTRSAIVQTLKKALEARDFITEGHADRMQEVVRLLGVELGLPDAKLAELQLFAQFHDIGKVGIPDGILFKPGRLTAEELVVMHSHSEIGYRIARSASDLVFIADWILKHHEAWNGSGYPLGLKGVEIPLECRILAIADAYDAMTNKRPYRLPVPKEKAVEEIRKNAGVQFDPELVKVFIKILPKLP